MILVFQAQCLHTVTEDNTSAAQLLCGSSDLMKVLEKSLLADGTTSEMLMLKVLTAGIKTFAFLWFGNKFNPSSMLMNKKKKKKKKPHQPTQHQGVSLDKAYHSHWLTLCTNNLKVWY